MTGEMLSDRRGFPPSGRHGLGITLLLLHLMVAPPADAFESSHPLEPPDTFSPRGTLETLLHSIDEAWDRFSARDETFREPFRRAARCFDVSGFPPEAANELAAESALLLKEVLDRIELPPNEEIPGPREVAEQGLQKWRIPHSEIDLVRPTEGEREGEFLFSSSTVVRLPEFFEKVRHLPYQPGKEGGHYDEVRSGALSPGLALLASRLPPWAKAEIGNHLLWQWLLLLASLMGAVALGGVAFRWGRRWAERERGSRGRPRFGPVLFPVTVIALVTLELALFDRLIRLAGASYHYGRLSLIAITDLAVAWLIVIVLTALGERVIHYSRAGERPLDAQLIRLSFRILTILVVTGFLFLAAESLGLPVPAIVAGLGVGGLAVALATQGTLENLIGGIILYADQPVRVGDFFRFGDKMGTVEEIGIRSTRIRTLDRTIVAVPNAELVRMQLENFSRRDRIRLLALLRLRMETTPDQLRYLVTRLHQMLLAHPKIAGEGMRVRLSGVGDYSLDVELWAFATTTDWAEFLAIRQDVLLRAMTLVEEAGTRLAIPVRVELEGMESGFDQDRRRRAEDTARRWREEGRLEVPEYPEADVTSEPARD
jgi:MscS family membrane protein